MKADQSYLNYLIFQISEKDDEKSFELLFKLLYKRLNNFSYNFVHSRELAEEIVSDVFIKLWNNRKKLSHIEAIDTYLYIATKNQSLNQISYLSSHHLSSDKDQIELNNFVDNFDPEKEFELSQLISDINLAVDSLPSQCKTVYKLIREDGFKYKQVAEILNISVRTVETQLVRAMKKLSIALKSHTSLDSFSSNKK